MSASGLHKIYAGAIALLIVFGLVLGNAWSSHVRDDATRDAAILTQKSDIASLEQKISTDVSAAQARIAELEKQKRQVAASPAAAPAIIREVLPLAAEPRSREAAQQLPDAPQPQGAMTLTQRDQQELAQFIITCKQCSVERDQLQRQVSDDQAIIAKQKTEVDAATNAAKGGSTWQRARRVLKWGAIFAGVGYVAGRAQR